MPKLIRSWREDFRLDSPPYIHDEDRKWFDLIGRDKAAGFNSFDDFASASDFSYDGLGRFQLGLVPQPFMGDIRKAKFFMLMLNPGFSPLDYFAEEQSGAFKRALMRNIRQDWSDDDWPFIWLNPEFAWHTGFRIFYSRFKEVADMISEEAGCTRRDALRYLSRHVAMLELMPYHSSAATHVSRQPDKLPWTSRLALDFVKEELMKRVDEGKAWVLVGRAADSWGANSWNEKKREGVQIYTGGECRSVSFNEASGARKLLMKSISAYPFVSET